MEVPSWLRIMAQRCQTQLNEYGKTLEDAVNFYLPHLQATNRSCTVDALVQELLEIKKRDGASARYLLDLNSRLGQFAGKFAKKLAAEITATQVDQWLRSLDVSPTTTNNFRRVLIVAFNFAKDRGYCTTNPVTKSAKAKEVENVVGILRGQKRGGPAARRVAKRQRVGLQGHGERVARERGSQRRTARAGLLGQVAGATALAVARQGLGHPTAAGLGAARPPRPPAALRPRARPPASGGSGAHRAPGARPLPTGDGHGG